MLQGAGIAKEVLSALKQKIPTLHASAACTDSAADLEQPAELLQKLSSPSSSGPKAIVVCAPAQSEWTLESEIAYLDSLSQATKAAYSHNIMAYVSDSAVKVCAKKTSSSAPHKQTVSLASVALNALFLHSSANQRVSILALVSVAINAFSIACRFCLIYCVAESLVAVCRGMPAPAGPYCKAWNFQLRCLACSYLHMLPPCQHLTLTYVMTNALHK